MGLILLISPGILAMYVFQKDVFLELEFFKLIFLSISFIAPFFIINTLIFMSPVDKGGKDDLFLSMIVSLFLSGFIFYSMLGISFLAHFDIGLFTTLLVIGEFVAVIYYLMVVKKKK